MKYKNGREAKLHDLVVGVDHGGKTVKEILVRITEGVETGNGRLADNSLISLRDCLHAEDAE